MPSIQDLVASMQRSPKNVRFADLVKVCDHYFGESRQKGSHHAYKMPWQGDPRVNLQEGSSGKAKSYQVKQVLAAIEKLEQK